MNTESEYSVALMKLAPKQEVVHEWLGSGYTFQDVNSMIEKGEYVPLTEKDAKKFYLYSGLKFKSFDTMTEQDLEEAKAKYAAYMEKREAAHKEAEHWEIYLEDYERKMPYIIQIKEYSYTADSDSTSRLRIPTLEYGDILISYDMRGSFDEDFEYAQDGILFALDNWNIAPLRKIDADLIEIFEGVRYKSAEEMSLEEEEEFRNYRVNNEVAPDIEEPDNLQKPDTCIILPNCTEEIEAPADLKLETGLTIIYRQFRRCHRVVVTDNMDARFLYRGKEYKTLAEIARKIVHTPVSGIILFNLPFTECFI